MLLTSFKTAAKIITGTSIKQVFFDYKQVVNIERTKLYPYVIWNMNSWKAVIDWANTSRRREKVTVKVFCIDYWDRGAVTETDTMIAVWDAIRDSFRVYCTVLNTNGYIQIINLNKMPCEYFEIGLTVDSEIGVSFDVELDLFCNT